MKKIILTGTALAAFGSAAFASIPGMSGLGEAAANGSAPALMRVAEGGQMTQTQEQVRTRLRVGEDNAQGTATRTRAYNGDDSSDDVNDDMYEDDGEHAGGGSSDDHGGEDHDGGDHDSGDHDSGSDD